MTTDPASEPRASRRRLGWRLKTLLAIDAVLFGSLVLFRVDPALTRWLGPRALAVYDALNPAATTGQRFLDAVFSLGGRAQASADGSHDDVRLDGTDIRDPDLGRLLHRYGNRIGELDLRNTRISNNGLRHLSGLPNLQRLALGNDDVPRSPGKRHWISPITDAGLAHLRDLPSLVSLNLSGLPVTDAGLVSVAELTDLEALSLRRTQVQGTNLTRLKSLSKLRRLHLDECPLTDRAVSQLAGAKDLNTLTLNQVPLTIEALKSLQGLPRLHGLETKGCGIAAADVAALNLTTPWRKGGD